MIILMAGLPGTGKTTLARALADRLDGAVLNKDEIRAALFAPADIEYSTEQDDLVQNLMLEAMEFMVRKNPERVIILDGRTFSRSYQIEKVIETAARWHQPWTILECVCAEETARQRLQHPGHPAQNRDFDLYKQVKGRFEPITQAKKLIDTNQPLEDCIRQAIS